MGIIDSAKRLVGGDSKQEQSVLYRCLTCRTEFEDENRQASDVECPSCGANAVQKVT